MSEQQTETFNGVTHIGVVLDKSGSMGVVRQETIGGFNAWLETMKQGPGDARLTLTLFDTSFQTPIKGAPVEKVNPLDSSRYVPGGSTALLDAVAQTIRDLAETATVNGHDRYLICIVTDGQENSSVQMTKESLLDLIKAQEATGRWTFTYLSASPDAFADAQSIGIGAMNTQAYTPDSIGTTKAFRSVGVRTMNFRASGALAVGDFYGGEKHAEGGNRRPTVIPPQMPLAGAPQPSTWTSDAITDTGTSEWVSG